MVVLLFFFFNVACSNLLPTLPLNLWLYVLDFLELGLNCKPTNTSSACQDAFLLRTHSNPCPKKAATDWLQSSEGLQTCRSLSDYFLWPHSHPNSLQPHLETCSLQLHLDTCPFCFIPGSMPFLQLHLDACPCCIIPKCIPFLQLCPEACPFWDSLSL